MNNRTTPPLVPLPVLLLWLLALSLLQPLVQPALA